jgi:hypothetical protein
MKLKHVAAADWSELKHNKQRHCVSVCPLHKALINFSFRKSESLCNEGKKEKYLSFRIVFSAACAHSRLT